MRRLLDKPDGSATMIRQPVGGGGVSFVLTKGWRRFMVMRRMSLLFAAAIALPAAAQPLTMLPGVRAEVRPISTQVPTGRPVWVRFSIHNMNDEAVTLQVPGRELTIPSPEVGLPISHILGGNSPAAVTVSAESGRYWDEPLGHRKSAEAPLLLLAPHSTVGATLNMKDYFPALRGAGQYRITWQPYGGMIEAQSAVVTIAPLKYVEIITDTGSMTIRFFYADAPNHVANFLDLVESGFYMGKRFHRIEPGYLLQGGCPRGDGTGIRPDGKRVAAEFHDTPFRKGSVAMALLDDDPDSASCQFFICYTRQKEWDGRYTIFGELIGEQSFETLDQLMATPVDEEGRPTQPLVMRNVRSMPAPPDEVP
jgi:peptidyl-prolyl cis-trans isomerase B (cyclophilin B)